MVKGKSPISDNVTYSVMAAKAVGRGNMEQPGPSNPMDFLIADLKHFGESLWRSEEIGEKRFNFFLTLVTAIIAGLVALHTNKEKLVVEVAMLGYVTSSGFGGLLIFGLLTYLRMLHRNRITDQYQRTLKHIRCQLLALHPSLKGYEVPQPINAGTWKWFRGGLAETIGAIDAILLGILLILNSVYVVWASMASLLLFIILWGLAAHRKGVS